MYGDRTHLGQLDKLLPHQSDYTANCANRWICTTHTWIFNPVLYYLSYIGVCHRMDLNHHIPNYELGALTIVLLWLYLTGGWT